MEPFKVATDKPVKSGDLYTFSNGATYSGQIRNGKMHGQGTYTDPSGSVYMGEWQDGLMHGTGTCTSEDGEEYKGEYYQGVPHGKGVYKFKNGNVYEGNYSQGRIHGFGVIKFPDNRRFEGEFKDNKKNGHGRYEGTNGIYEGSYVDGKKEGFGCFTWIDGSCYEGPWKADFMHGEGKKKEKDGRMYEVTYNNGKVVNAVPLQSPSTSSLPRSRAEKPRDRQFSHTALPPSIRSFDSPGGGAGSQFSKTLVERGQSGEDSYDGHGGMEIIERGDDEEQEQAEDVGPAAWLKDRWQNLQDIVSCGASREKIHKKGRELCGGAWEVVEANDCGGPRQTTK